MGRAAAAGLWWLAVFGRAARSDDAIGNLVARLRDEAAAAYDASAEGAGAVGREAFVDDYVTLRLQEATLEILEAKGYAAPHLEDAWRRGAGEAVEALDAAGRAREVSCGDGGAFCGRFLAADLASEAESELLVARSTAAMSTLFHQGGSTSLAPEPSEADRLGPDALAVVDALRCRASDAIRRHLRGPDSIRPAGALLTRLSGEPAADEWELNASHVYWGPHVDRDNVAGYAYSALVYLNTQGADFSGGDLEFLDADARRVVHPKRGLLLAFTSGAENRHRVTPVTRGDRFVLAMWFASERASPAAASQSPSSVCPSSSSSSYDGVT